MAEIVQITTAPSRAMYEAASAEVGSTVPAGLIVHTATESADGTVRIIDVWESREAADAFDKDVLTPIIERQMAAAGESMAGPGPELEVLEPFSVIR